MNPVFDVTEHLPDLPLRTVTDNRVADPFGGDDSQPFSIQSVGKEEKRASRTNFLLLAPGHYRFEFGPLRQPFPFSKGVGPHESDSETFPALSSAVG